MAPRRLTARDVELPRSTGDVDASFLSAALRVPTPARVDVHEVLDGTTGRVRLSLHAADGTTADLFVKVPARRRRARLIAELPSLTAAEARFYDELAPRVRDVPPHRFAAHRAGRFAVVLEDLTGSCELHDGDHAWTPQEAGSVLDALARLHATFWNDPRLDADGDLGWLGALRRREAVLGDLLAIPLTGVGLRRAGDLVPEALRDPARRHARRRRRHMAALATGDPTTVIHADCHPGNVAFSRDDGSAVLCDWQLVRSGSWARDVAYAIATGLEPAARREHGAALLARYLATLVSAGGPALDPVHADTLRRAHSVVALEAMLVTMAVGGLMSPDVVRTLVGRTARAVGDEDGFGALAAVAAGGR